MTDEQARAKVKYLHELADEYQKWSESGCPISGDVDEIYPADLWDASVTPSSLIPLLGYFENKIEQMEYEILNARNSPHD